MTIETERTTSNEPEPDLPPVRPPDHRRTEDQLVTDVIDDARAEHGHELSRDHILAEVRGEDPDEVHKRGI